MLVVLVATGLIMAGCGKSEGPFPLPGPAASPMLRDVPAGVIVPVGTGAQGVVVDSITATVAVAVTGPNRVVLTDETGRVVSQSPVSGPVDHLALVGPGGPVLAPVESTGTLSSIDEASGAVQAWSEAGHQFHDAVVAAGKIFVADRSPSQVSAVVDNRVVGSVPAPAVPDGLATDGVRVAVVGSQARKVAVFNASTDEIVGTAPAGDGPTQVAGADGYFYVIDTAGNKVLVFQAGSKLVNVGNYSVGGAPYGVAIDRVHHKLWVTLTAVNQLAEFSYNHGVIRRIDTFPTVRQPNSVAVDAVRGWVFVTGSIGGVLEIIHPLGTVNH